MDRNELVNEILQNIENSETNSITCLVGKNSTGKTWTLNDVFTKISETDNISCLFLRAETTFSNETSIKQNGEQLFSDIHKFINKILCKQIKIKQKDIINHIKEIKCQLNSFYQDVENINDDYFLPEIKNSFLLDDSFRQNNDFFYRPNIINKKLSIKNYSSGEGMYTLLLFCYKLLSRLGNDISTKIVLIIDEPEKFCHNTLIKKNF